MIRRRHDAAPSSPFLSGQGGAGAAGQGVGRDAADGQSGPQASVPGGGDHSHSHDRPPATDGILIKTPGLLAQDGAHHVDEAPAVPERILRPAWVSDALLAETVEVWSEAYGRLVGEAEAMEILMNTKRLGEALLKAKTEGRR